mgnify:CR=1 FL=1
MKTFRLYWFFTLLLLLAGCNQKDDVNEIFSSGQTWHWSNSYSTSDWKDDNKFNSTLTRDEVAKINDSRTATTSFSRKTVPWKATEVISVLPAHGVPTEKTRAFLSS